MVLVFHGNVCCALLVSLFFRFGAVSALDSQFGFGSVCLEVPSFVEMIPSRGWRFLDVPSLLNVCPPVSLVEEWMAMAALSLLQFGNPGMPSFVGDFFGAGCFIFDFKGSRGRLWYRWLWLLRCWPLLDATFSCVTSRIGFRAECRSLSSVWGMESLQWTLGFRLLLILIEGVLSGAGGNQLVYFGLFLGASWSAFLV